MSLSYSITPHLLSSSICLSLSMEFRSSQFLLQDTDTGLQDQQHEGMMVRVTAKPLPTLQSVMFCRRWLRVISGDPGPHFVETEAW